MKIAVIKPDWRISGGFEKVLARVEADLTADGHQLRRFQIDVPTVNRQPFGIEVPVDTWERAPQWFTHLALLDAFRHLDVSWADMVLSTQPPSYAVSHPRHLALFYHHARAFYDLEQVWISSGWAPELLHTMASALLRQSEAADLAAVTHYLAGSERVVRRLQEFAGPTVPSSLYQAAGPVVDDHPDGEFGHVLCVSRHEFTKRTELAVLGVAAADGLSGVLVGDGGRLPFVRRLATEVARGLDPAELVDEQIWLNTGITDDPEAAELTGQEHPRVSIRGRVGDDQLAALYRDALCVLAPAYDEDDGLTVVEAMSHGKPVIVCADGGGLTALVQDGINGFVVEPTAAGIAHGLRRLADDRGLARRMGANGRETARERTPERAHRQLSDAVEQVLSAG